MFFVTSHGVVYVKRRSGNKRELTPWPYIGRSESYRRTRACPECRAGNELLASVAASWQEYSEAYHIGAVLTAVFWEVASAARPFEGTGCVQTGLPVRNIGDRHVSGDLVSRPLKDAASYPGLPFEIISIANLLKLSGHYMYHQFNIQQFYVLPTHCIYVFCVDLRTNSDYFHIQH
jgi:hypothetical protein